MNFQKRGAFQRGFSESWFLKTVFKMYILSLRIRGKRDEEEKNKTRPDKSRGVSRKSLFSLALRNQNARPPYTDVS